MQHTKRCNKPNYSQHTKQHKQIWIRRRAQWANVSALLMLRQNGSYRFLGSNIASQSKRYGRGQQLPGQQRNKNVLPLIFCHLCIVWVTYCIPRKRTGDYRSMAFDTAAKWEKTCITFVCLWFAGQAPHHPKPGQQTRATKMQLAMSILWPIRLGNVPWAPRTGMCKQNTILCVFLQNGM